jgi:predicted Kef-type K+ transport protein
VFDVIVLLAVATVGLIAGRALRLRPIVAYLVAGLLVGPGGLGLVAHSHSNDQHPELGVASSSSGSGSSSRSTACDGSCPAW